MKPMNTLSSCPLVLLGILLFCCLAVADSQAAPKKVLIVTTTTGFRHSSIPTAEKVITQLGEKSGAFTVDYAQQPAHQPNPPKKPKGDASQEEMDKYKEAEAKFKTDEADWQAALNEAL